MRLTRFNPETGEYEYIEKAKTLGEYRAQRKAAIQRLGELEDKIEQGKIVELPCAVGQNGYWLVANDIRLVTFSKIFTIGTEWRVRACWLLLENKYFSFEDFGKTVFLDRAEAEAKLREMKGENDEQR